MGAHKSKEPLKKPRPQRKELDLSSVPARVDSVKVAGLQRTYDDYVLRAANGLFKAKSFRDVLTECNEARLYLNELGIFKEIDVHIDISRGEKATPDGYEVTFKGKELSRIVGAVGTEIGQNEGSLNMELSSPNIFGRGESLSLQGSYSNYKTNDLRLKLTKPFFHTRFMENRPEISLSLFRHGYKMDISAFRNRSVGILADFSVITNWPIELRHSFQYETSVRQITVLKKSAPFFVREYCGPRMVSLFRHIVAYDQRDNPVFPNYGTFVRTTNEFSGFGGNIAYMMNHTHAEISIPLNFGCVAQICSKFGIIQPDKKSRGVPISSLFVFGGPQTLRGFKYGGSGPHIDGYSAGAHSYWSTGLHLWAPLPFNSNFGRFANNFRTHLFYNFGNFNSFSTDNMRSSMGFGLAYKFADRARIELNYCVPIDKQMGDKATKGFEFSIGYEFI